MAGLHAVFRTQAAFRQELFGLLLALPAAWILTARAVERALMIGSWMLVMIVEIINSAIETAVDRIGKEPHELSGRAKDLGSAAVFCSLVLAATIWGIILLSKS
jgi:diacylglycerol kinase (ATP)